MAILHLHHDAWIGSVTSKKISGVRTHMVLYVNAYMSMTYVCHRTLIMYVLVLGVGVERNQ